MKISVIIPTYKPEYYIWECLNSLRSQTLEKTDYEVIIILNGEKEPFFSKIKSYIEVNGLKNFYLFYTEEKGVSSARNLGLDISQGKYISFIDDDDYIDDNYLKELLNIIEKKGNNGIAVTNYLDFDEVTKKELYKTFYRENFCTEDIKKMRKIFSMVCIKLIPKNIIQNYRFKNFINGEDSLFMLEISKNIKYISMVENNVFYHRRVRNRSAHFKKKKVKYILKNSCNLLKEYMKLLSDEYNKSFIIIRMLALVKGTLFQIKNNYRSKEKNR